MSLVQRSLAVNGWSPPPPRRRGWLRPGLDSALLLAKSLQQTPPRNNIHRGRNFGAHLGICKAGFQLPISASSQFTQ